MHKNTRVTILYWYEDVDDLARTVAACLAELGYDPLFRHYTTDNYEGARFLFTYAPWGRLQRITTQLEQMPPAKRPFWIHWSTEDCPDLRLPKLLVESGGRALAWFDRLQDREGLAGRLARTPLAHWIHQRGHKFRYVGMYEYALHQGLMGLLLEYSRVYADYYQALGLPVRYARWGLIDEARAETSDVEENGERDIDVLWIGTRRTRRRSRLLDQVIGQLNELGKHTVVIDGVNHPPVYGQERARLLRRAKITLNLLPTWYDSALAYRWPLAAASRSLLVTEESLPHAPEYLAGEHYVAAPVSSLVETICYYLDHPEERTAIVEKAYQAAIGSHTILNSVQQIMQWAEEKLRLGNVADAAFNRTPAASRVWAPVVGLALTSLSMWV
jgi:hypothetical protein